MTQNPLHLSPMALPVESRLHKFFLLPSQWVRPHRDSGKVIVTVPAFGCPGVSRWDLTRHTRLIQGAKWARMLRGERISLTVNCLLLHPNICQTFVKATVDCLLSNNTTYTVLQHCLMMPIHFLKNAVQMNCECLYIFFFKEKWLLLIVISHQQCDGVLLQLMG